VNVGATAPASDARALPSTADIDAFIARWSEQLAVEELEARRASAQRQRVDEPALDEAFARLAESVRQEYQRLARASTAMREPDTREGRRRG
jgi:hypothetical protein